MTWALMLDEFSLFSQKISDATDRVQNCNMLMFKPLNKSGIKERYDQLWQSVY